MKMKLSKTMRLVLSTVLIIVALILKESIGYHFVTIIFMIMTTILAGAPIVKKALSGLRFRIVGIEALVTIAVTGAIIIGEYWEAAAVTYLFMLGDYLEARTLAKTRSSIQSLLELAPTQARVINSTEEVLIDPKLVKVGEIILVKPGEKIPVDGSVLEGTGYVNQATITGESLPIGIELNQEMFAGTILESGYVKLTATRVGKDTTFSKIINLVEEAQDKKAKTQKFLDRFARYYTPAIIVFAIVFYLITFDVKLALTFLVISCPGALVISAPVSIVAGIGNGARRGVLVKGGEIMEKLGKIRVVSFDKTGTLTKGLLQVQSVIALEESENEIIKIASIGEKYSEHPIARAIIKEAEVRFGKVLAEPSNVQIITGQGLTFCYQDNEYLLGNRKLFENANINLSKEESLIQAEEAKGETVVIVGKSDKVIGLIGVADTIREEAPALIRSLKKQGIKKIIMLTGDNERAAKKIANELKLDHYYAELLPEQKVEAISELQKQYEHVAMVGDGVNDAPALAFASLGIAIGGAGSAVAIETADVVLMSARLERLDYAIRLSKATVRNLKQNIYFAILVAITLLIGVITEWVNLAVGMLVHELSVLIVILNAIRLLRFKARNKK